MQFNKSNYINTLLKLYIVEVLFLNNLLMLAANLYNIIIAIYYAALLPNSDGFNNLAVKCRICNIIIVIFCVNTVPYKGDDMKIS